MFACWYLPLKNCIASAYIPGRTLAEKEIMNIGGVSVLKDSEKSQELLAAIEKGSKLLASANKIKEMKAAISNQLTQL